MKCQFSIIGFTGPLGSGCSRVADFVCSELEEYKFELEKEKKDIELYVDKYYRFLRKNRVSHEEDVRQTQLKSQKNYVEPDDLLLNYQAGVVQSGFEDSMKIINRKLRRLLQRRKLVEYYCSEEWPRFVKISLSDVIMKLVLQKSLTADGEISNGLEKCSPDLVHPKAKDMIIAVAKKHLETANEFNRLVKEKKYKEINVSFCAKFDLFLAEIRELKNDLLSGEYVDNLWLQDVGDNLRASGDPFVWGECQSNEYLDILSQEANKIVKYYRRREDGNASNYFVIDSFRNPAEIEFFKRYGSFFVCSVFASRSVRRNRLASGFNEKAENRDQGKYNRYSDVHKQNVPECVLISDYAINNDGDTEGFKYEVSRLLCLIDRPGLVPPDTDEVFMNAAYNISLRSTCLSRQVGAIITNKEGYIISSGWNDVGSGQIGCSLNCVNDFTKYSTVGNGLEVWREKIDEFKKEGVLKDISENDFFCFKDLESKLALKRKVDKAFRKILDGNDCTAKRCITPLKVSECEEFKNSLVDYISIKRLEYARALHAEENALLQAARFGGVGVADGTIYTTTYPCELCAKKIYQSQIKRVVYTEPYPDSLSENIFLKDGVRVIRVDQFEGVKSPSFHRLFKARHNLKEAQLLKSIVD